MTTADTAIISSPAIRWFNKRLELLDQRALPHQTLWLPLSNADGVADAIRDMVVRGAPAIGISAAYGVVLAAMELGVNANQASLKPAIDLLAASRPTAVNLFWALERMQSVISEQTGLALIASLTAEAEAIHRDDREMNHRLAEFGAALFGKSNLGVSLIPEGKSVYTHCNTGALATGGHGTALGIIRSAWESKKIVGVYAGETRPWMQGARLTSWELMQDDIPVTLVVDSAAGHVMKSGKIGAVIVGADRITANGDAANKIGTYNLAVLAKHHGIAFIVAAPLSTLDPDLADGSLIDIEERNADEVRTVQGKPIAPTDVPVFNPAFDVTPAELISAIVTEHGVIEQPDTAKMAAHLRSAGVIA
ncbi:MAG: S-methyl-5-thioribose-1-phosphate isomerase [Alcanivoracaceae bacterium]|nr:S-methyl-5-thioribose-1-phosphate isomerase [Alcanivoracaceae bacterium]